VAEMIPLDQVSVVLYLVTFALGFILGLVRRGANGTGGTIVQQPPPPPPSPQYTHYPTQPPQVQYPVQQQPLQANVQSIQPRHVHASPNGKVSINNTAYLALAELGNCKRGIVVVESGRVLCVEGDEQARVIWSLEGGSHGS